MLIDGVPRWETFREIADPYHSQSIRRRHTWGPKLLPHLYLEPQSPTPPHHNTPHILLTSSSKKQASNSPTGPGGLARKTSCARSGTHFARLATWCAQSQRRWDTGAAAAGMGPAHCRVHISGASRPRGARSHTPNSLLDLPAKSANIFAEFAQNLVETFPHYGLAWYAP